MDFLRLHLPGLHQALRGALDSFSTFVSYLIGDGVPTVQREAQAAEELGEVAAGEPGKAVEVKAQEALESLRGSQSEGVGGLGRSGGTGRCQEGSSTGEQFWRWGADSSHGSQADRQDTETWEVARGQEPSAPLEAGKESEAGPGIYRDRSSGTWKSQEPGEQEVSRGEMLRTWEQQEEEEEVRVTEPGMARGVESQLTWHQEPEWRADTDGQKLAEDRRETEQVIKEASAETKEPGAEGAGRGEEGVIVVRGDESTRVQESQGPGIESEDYVTSGREEASTAWDRKEARTSSGQEEARAASIREEADLLGVKETEYRSVPGEGMPEATGIVWVLEEAPMGDQEEEVYEKKEDEKREDETRLFPRQTQALGMKGTEEVAEGQTAGREATGGKKPESGDSSEGEAEEQADGASLEEVAQIEEAQGEKGSCQTMEPVLAMDKDAEIEADLEAVPETRPEEEFMGEKSKEAQMNQKILEVKFTEGQEPEPMGGTQTPNEQPEEGQGGQHKLGRNLGLCKEEAESRVEAHLRLVAETLENQKRRDVESRNAQEEKAGTEGTEEAAAGDQALEAKAEGGQESELSEVLGCGAEEGQASVSENQELEGHQGAEAEAGPGQSLEESEAGESKFSEMETAVPWETDRVSRGGCKLEEAVLSLQDSKDPQTSSLSAEIVKEALPHRAAGAGEGPDQEAGVAWEGAFERSWDSEGREEAVEIENQGGQEVGSVGSAEEEATDHSSQAEASEARKEEQAEVGGSTMTERSNEMDGVTSVSQGARTERDTAMVEAEGLLGEQMVLEEETEGEQVREQRKGSKDHHEKEETQRLLDAEDIMTRGQMPEAQQAGPGLKDIQGQEEQPAHQVPAEAGLGSSETAEPLESTRGDTDSCWSEALLPGSRLDVSVPRSRVLLSRSSSQRRSRPSFRRTPAAEQQEDSPCPQPEEGLLAPEQRPLQSEEAPEHSPPRPEGTPIPARRRPLGHGFGLAHPSMMQELQARMGRPKPQ
ncbi:apolipoprotein B receptor [Castor canadensis]|uniref:apolipoprotein B receptor n=1 Tax=Castor canadensis TaxID=51338 RepID=UPI003D17A242